MTQHVMSTDANENKVYRFTCASNRSRSAVCMQNIVGVTVPHLGISTRLRVLKITTPGVMDIESTIVHEKIYPTALEMFP